MLSRSFQLPESRNKHILLYADVIAFTTCTKRTLILCFEVKIRKKTFLWAVPIIISGSFPFSRTVQRSLLSETGRQSGPWSLTCFPVLSLVPLLHLLSEWAQAGRLDGSVSKGVCHRALWPEFSPQVPPGGRREQISVSCALTPPTCMPWYAHTHNK